jgi:hypothetical protein
MAVLTYKGGKYRNLAGNQIYDGSAWNLLKGDSKIFLNGKWYNFGWETINVPLDEVTLPKYPGMDLDIGLEQIESSRCLYVTPTGAGKMDGSSWDNAFSSINTAMQYNTNNHYILCKGGVYKESRLYGNNHTYCVGGFGEDGTWENRNTLKNPTMIEVDGEIYGGYSFYGFVGKLWDSTFGCVVVGTPPSGVSRGSMTNCVCVNSSGSPFGTPVNSTFINCTLGYFSNNDTDDVKLAFLNCLLGGSNGAFLDVTNALCVNCNIGASELGAVFPVCDCVSCANCNFLNYKGRSSGSASSFFFNCGNSESGFAWGANDNDKIFIGDDNTLAKFTNTGYNQQGIVDIGPCPLPYIDPQGFTSYVNSFGDWHPLPDSILVGRGGNIGGTDLDGVTRPNPPTIGCYEPRPQETE